MTDQLIIAMLLLCSAAVVSAMLSKNGILRSFLVPVAVGFFYTGVVQARDSLKNPPIDLSDQDVSFALLVALVAFSSFLVGYGLPRKAGFAWTIDKCDFKRLRLAATVVSILGIAGYLTVVIVAGGISSYFGPGTWKRNIYEDLSGYVYSLKYLLQAGMGLAIIARAHRQLTPWADALLLLAFGAFAIDALKTGDRGDMIRIFALFCAWVMTRGRGGASQSDGQWSRWGVIGVVTTCVVLSVLLFPYLRGADRNVFVAEVGINEAVSAIQEQGAASRFGAEGGGEFDYAARIGSAIRAGTIKHSGPAPLLRFFWNLIPRHFFPEKHQVFRRLIGEDYYLMCELRSYEGCAPTGWGESFGLMGWWGVVLYWLVWGVILKRIELVMQDWATGIVTAMVSVLPLVQFVVMECWAGLMNIFYLVIPFAAGLWFASKPRETPANKLRPKRKRFAATQLELTSN